MKFVNNNYCIFVLQKLISVIIVENINWRSVYFHYFEFITINNIIQIEIQKLCSIMKYDF